MGGKPRLTTRERGRPPTQLSEVDRAEVVALAEQAHECAARWPEVDAVMQARRQLKRAEAARSRRGESLPGFDSDPGTLFQIRWQLGRYLVQLADDEGVPLPTERQDERAILVRLLRAHGYEGTRRALALRLVDGTDIAIADDRARSLEKQALYGEQTRGQKEMPSRMRAARDDAEVEEIDRDSLDIGLYDSPCEFAQNGRAYAEATRSRSDEQRRADRDRDARIRLLLGVDEPA